MKKNFFLSFTVLSLLIGGCSFQEYVHTTEPRSTIYIGQTAADVYENFGVPTKIERLDTNKQILIYHKQEIEKDWSYRYFHECELKFYMVDDRVQDWSKKGDMCAVKELSSASERPYFNLLDENSSYADHKEINGSIVPLDAFRDSENFAQEEKYFEEPVEEEKGFFSNWFSDEPKEEVLEEKPAYITQGQNNVFIGNQTFSDEGYQNNSLNYMDIPDDAF